ncbi:MAG TPA: FAD-dependent oxidoreductase [Xanthobacteraceae bacterium]|nr:FAD-dependent oxidoreductase [Xanthobacteraceae bacterium]
MEQTIPAGPDLTLGVGPEAFADGKLLGHVGGEEVLLVQGRGGVFAVGPYCSHYHAPLAEGVVVENSIRCPWHHACFDLRSGEATCAPAFSALDAWHVEERGGRFFVFAKKKARTIAQSAANSSVKNIVIIGGGAAGFAAAEMLRRLKFSGRITVLSSEASAPVDRPNLSKDYLAGTAPEEWLPLRPESYYLDADIQLHLQTEVIRIDTAEQRVFVKNRGSLSYDRLLLATGAEPVRLEVPGASEPYVHVLRSLADCRAIIRAAKDARRAFVIGASFIGLETAAALRARGLEVHVVAPEKRPMARIFGAEMADAIRALHEEHGVVFHLGQNVASLAGGMVKLANGESFATDLVIVGIGVRPRLALAEQAGIAINHGVTVNQFLETSVPGIFAAGDIARWPDPHSNENIRAEHWVVAQRQGQVAAMNMLGARKAFEAVPYFWSQHYDIPINYVGHAEEWDDVEIEGDIRAKDCLLRYRKDGRICAVASIFRDTANLQAEIEMERNTAAKQVLRIRAV